MLVRRPRLSSLYRGEPTVKDKMYELLRNLKPRSAEERYANRRELAMRSIARYGRGSIPLQHGRVLFEEDLERRKMEVAERLRHHQP